MKIFIVLLFATMIVDIIELSGFITTIKRWIFLFVSPGKKNAPENIDAIISLKPFDCVLCFTWWTCFIISCGYVFSTYETRTVGENIFLCSGLFLYSAVLAYYSEIVMNFFQLFKLILLHLCDYIYEKFNLADQENDDEFAT